MFGDDMQIHQERFGAKHSGSKNVKEPYGFGGIPVCDGGHNDPVTSGNFGDRKHTKTNANNDGRTLTTQIRLVATIQPDRRTACQESF
jgi:hypothetical protein